MVKAYSVGFLLFLVSIPAITQPVLNQFVDQYYQYNQERLQEKIYVHLDRSLYTVGETLWFKLYLVDGTLHQPIGSSLVAYVEILKATGESVLQTKVLLENGMGAGQLVLPTSLNTENYEVRAYTQWMKNFDPDFYFHQYITIVNPFRPIELKTQPKPDLDIQLFPEGGQLIEDIPSWVAVRAVDQNGNGVPYEGYLLSDTDTISKFKPIRFGLSKFSITPSLLHTMKVLIKNQKGEFTVLNLPAVEPNGYSLQVNPTDDRFKISISAKGESAAQLFVVVHTRQVIKVANVVTIQGDQANLEILKSDLDAGVSRITVFNSELKPVAERLVYIKPVKQELALTTNQSEYKTRSKISIQVQSGKTLSDSVNFSMAVFRDDSVTQLMPASIETYLWLTSDLKGSIESPHYYFSNAPDVDEVGDLLMLTHGWSRFRWNELKAARQPLLYLPEHRGHLINGIVSNRINHQPVSNQLAYLSWPQKRIQLTQAVSSSGGNVLFETNRLFGKQTLYFQTPADSLTIFQFISPFSHQPVTKIPALSISETIRKPLANRSVSMQVQEIFRKPAVGKSLQADSSTFYGRASEQYALDSYTRFPVMEEVLREYVRGVRVRKKGDQFIFKILNTNNNTILENNPLVLLDGVPVFNINQIMEFDPLKIKYLDVVTSQYFFGSQTYDGLVSYRTYQGDLGGFPFDSKTVRLDYEGLQIAQEFFSPVYESSDSQKSRIPDARQVLLWIPHGVLKGHEQINFYSSDQPGRYTIVLQGISSTGTPVFQQGSLVVEK